MVTGHLTWNTHTYKHRHTQGHLMAQTAVVTWIDIQTHTHLKSEPKNCSHIVYMCEKDPISNGLIKTPHVFILSILYYTMP